jgi:hypothetical protein
MPLEKLDRPPSPAVSAATRINSRNVTAPHAEGAPGERTEPAEPSRDATACCALLRPAPSLAPRPQTPRPGEHRSRAKRAGGAR